jgi:hypothetical protein
MNKFNRQGGLARFDELYSLASAYVNQLQALSVRDPERVGRYLNKANVLRLIELYVHTIPAFGHVRHAQELLFETTHQLLKRAIFRSNMKEPQVTAVGATLSNYWETRLSMEVESLVESLGNPETWTDAECLRVQRLIAGKKETALPNMDQVRSVFCNPVLSELSQVSRRLTSREADGIMWRIEFEDPSRLEDVDGWIRLSTQYASVFQDALEHIRITQSQQSFRAWSVREANHASSWSTARSVRNAIPELRRRNGIIRTSFVVQALTSRNEYSRNDAVDINELWTFEESTQMQVDSFCATYWYALGVFNAELNPSCLSSAPATKGRAPFALVLPCEQVPGNVSWHAPMHVNSSTRVSTLRLSPSVQETLCIHACELTKQCRVNERHGVQHHETVGSGSPFYVFGRYAGFPPGVG